MTKTQISDRVDRLTELGFTPGEAIAIAITEAHQADKPQRP
jgi:Fe2+ transport system protein FeoA